MKKSVNFTFVLVLVLLASLFLFASIDSVEADPTPNLQVDPPSAVVNGGENLTMNLIITNVADLATWEFKLYYTGILNAIAATEGTFLKQAGLTAFFVVDVNNAYNATHGRVWLTCTLLANISGASGNGTLATVIFTPSSGGNTSMHLADTVLGDSKADPILHTTTDGQVEAKGIINIAATTMIVSRTIIGKGSVLNVNVTVENQSDLTETFNMSIFANNTSFQNKTVLLSAHNVTIISLSWNTSNFAWGIYNITAIAETLPGETNTTDNNLTLQGIILTISGDVNGDGIVDIYDAILIAKSFGSNPNKPNWNPNTDLNEDDAVDIYDAILLANNYGKTTS